MSTPEACGRLTDHIPASEHGRTVNQNFDQTWVWPCRPHKFKAVYAVTLHGELLRTDLRIINTGDKAFDFTAALHTYIEVLDIKKASVKGLKDLQYLDKVMQLMTCLYSVQSWWLLQGFKV